MRTNKFRINEELANTIMGEDHKKKDPNRFSITQLMGNIRENVLAESNDIEEDVSDCFTAFIGTCVHYYMEHHTGGKNEWKIEIPFEGNTVVGVIDHFENGEITDYKIKKCYDFNYEDAKTQIYCYAWMLKKIGIVADKGRIVIMRRDWSKIKNMDISPVEEILFNIDAFNAQYAEDFIRTQIEKYKKARIELPECTDEDKWYTGDSYAVYAEKGDARAKKIFQSKEDADNFAKGKMIVVKRPGIYMKCENFCKCRRVCHFFKKMENRG